MARLHRKFRFSDCQCVPSINSVSTFWNISENDSVMKSTKERGRGEYVDASSSMVEMDCLFPVLGYICCFRPTGH